MAKAIMLAVVAVTALAVQLAGAADHPVGGDGAWDASGGYNAWSAKQKIVQGDSISFKYTASHDVVEVTKAGYDACSGANPVKSYTGGATTVKLTAPGKRYFICSVPGHCAAGMKLEVTVAAASSTTGAAPAPSKSGKPSRHQRSAAPAPAPATAPEAPSSEPSSTVVSSPTAAPAPKSSDATSVGMPKAAGMALAVGMALAFAI